MENSQAVALLKEGKTLRGKIDSEIHEKIVHSKGPCDNDYLLRADSYDWEYPIAVKFLDGTLTGRIIKSSYIEYDSVILVETKKEKNTMEMKDFLMMQMFAGNQTNSTLGGLLPLLLLGGKGKKIPFDRAVLINSIPGLTDTEKQSISEGNTEAALTSLIAREMQKTAANPVEGQLNPMLLMLLLGE